mmetsp:Transcript_17840/g.26412  ORF Transcript_17840/g.26412 Transcript_17840/m.26412 type:complete len:235 (+) Transcript_17840:111-815(+)
MIRRTRSRAVATTFKRSSLQISRPALGALRCPSKPSHATPLAPRAATTPNSARKRSRPRLKSQTIFSARTPSPYSFRIRPFLSALALASSFLSSFPHGSVRSAFTGFPSAKAVTWDPKAMTVACQPRLLRQAVKPRTSVPPDRTALAAVAALAVLREVAAALAAPRAAASADLRKLAPLVKEFKSLETACQLASRVLVLVAASAALAAEIAMFLDQTTAAASVVACAASRTGFR